MTLRTQIARLERASPRPSVRPSAPRVVLHSPEQIDAAERLRLYLRSAPKLLPLALPPSVEADCRLVGLLGGRP